LRMLKFQFFGNQRGANPQICCRRFRPHPHDGFCTPLRKSSNKASTNALLNK
jgi:hypothetical protein